MPSWTFRAADSGRTPVSLALGRWIATDGAYVTEDAVDVGRIAMPDGFIDMSRTPDGLASVTLGHRSSALEVPQTNKVLVIDSGAIVIGCDEALRAGGITMRDHASSYKVLAEAGRVRAKDTDVVLIYDDKQRCIAIVGYPPWGDGAYRIEFHRAGDVQLVKALLGESC
jgi:hypothetical protein